MEFFFYPGPKSVANRANTDSKGAAYSEGQLDEMRLRRDNRNMEEYNRNMEEYNTNMEE